MGDWGFISAGNFPFSREKIDLTRNTQFLNSKVLPSLFLFGKDIQEIKVQPNHLNEPLMMQYYLECWKQWK